MVRDLVEVYDMRVVPVDFEAQRSHAAKAFEAPRNCGVEIRPPHAEAVHLPPECQPARMNLQPATAGLIVEPLPVDGPQLRCASIDPEELPIDPEEPR